MNKAPLIIAGVAVLAVAGYMVYQQKQAGMEAAPEEMGLDMPAPAPMPDMEAAPAPAPMPDMEAAPAPEAAPMPDEAPAPEEAPAPAAEEETAQ